ncbi:hypothetical protein [Stenotrophomonas maltophilia]|uniref:hypothetical protein n=1 Tax=Stenotrophomonas maltophilia TaxID=40324 RepID=UPI0039C194EC
MSNDNKTLADVQPGGRVRLGDSLPPLPCTGYSAYSDGTEPLYTAEQMQNYARAALSAHPSPGGQDALDCIGRIEEAIEFRVPHDIYAAVHGELAELKAALAGRQPVGQEPVAPKKMARAVALDLMQAVYEHHGWKRAEGESMTARVHAIYDVTLDAGRNRFVATPKPAAPPAQAVDLPYSLDADPAGIRARVADVITGTLMVGAQGHTPPPAGHWAEPFWKAARADAKAQAVDLDELRRAVCVVNVVGQIDGHDVVYRNSVLDVIDTRRQRLTDSQAVSNG